MYLTEVRKSLLRKNKESDDILVEQISHNLEQLVDDQYGEEISSDKKHEDSKQKKAIKNQKKQQKKQEKKESKRANREILIVAYFCMIVFVGMIIYLARFLASDNTDMLNNPYNKLQSVLEENTTKGNILTSDGKVLATTLTDKKGNEYRQYPYGRMFAHAVGYSGNGRTGIEADYNIYMLTSNINPVYKAISELQGKKSLGDNVVTTLDYDIQKVAYDALGTHRGAILVMNPDNGAIIAMVSKPDYDPNTIAEDWNNLIKDDDNSVLMNRVTQGLYPPGSTFKLVTMLEYIRENRDIDGFEYQCFGVTDIDGVNVNCHNKKAHGTMDLFGALAKSCNGAFATIGSSLDRMSFAKTCESLLFNSNLPYAGQYNKSIFDMPEEAGMGLVTQTSFGQGNTMISPLHNGIIVSAIANGGNIITPHLVDSIKNNSGKTIRKFDYSYSKKIMSENEVKLLRRGMKEVVDKGTATALSGQIYKAFGKTGSAEYDSSGNSHAWYVGYANNNGKKVAVSIIVEGAGTGSEYAVPIAKKIFAAYY